MMSEWRDIETAPKDGTVIRLFDYAGRVHAGRWDVRDLAYPWFVLCEQHVTNAMPADYFAGWQPLHTPPQTDRR